jgi:Domain of unknown function (DUF4157)
MLGMLTNRNAVGQVDREPSCHGCGARKASCQCAPARTASGQSPPLRSDVRIREEARFGRSFASVRLEENSPIADGATHSSAAATIGNQIRFSTRYDDSDIAHRRLLAHELARVTQQSIGRPSMAHRVPIEAEASRIATELPDRVVVKEGDQAGSERHGHTAGERSESCAPYIGTCDFYRCRQRNTGGTHAPTDYYLGYGLKYCDRFGTITRPLLSPAGQEWVDRTRTYLQIAAERSIPWDAQPQDVKRIAFGSHPECYVRGGVCFLPPSDWGTIWDTVDSDDMEIRQALTTGVFCGGNLLPLAFPVHGLAAGGGYGGLMERDRRRAFGQ